jgi:ubiquinone/menaquinone biosynthesis C-methylase UbiE
MLSRKELRRVYDRVGTWQDSQSFYERPAIERLVRHSAFGEASSVLEVGCGTGAFARRLLEDLGAPDLRYEAIELSPVMVDLAREAIAPFADRATIRQPGGAPPLDVTSDSVDRVVAAYVLDVMTEAEVRQFVAEARHVLTPSGRLCVCGLAPGTTAPSRLVSALWTGVHALVPSLVGGCRPLAIRPFLSNSHWRILCHETVTPWGVASEVLVAQTR